MATISTSQTFDSAARTAGETFTIDSGAIDLINQRLEELLNVEVDG